MILIGSSALGSSVTYVTSDKIITPELSANAIVREEAGFETDFLLLHCLLKNINPTTIFEVGTCQGYGTLIMANACPAAAITSLDLPPQSAPFFLPASDIGYKCTKAYKQVYGDSLSYNYLQHFPIDAWFLDGAHDYAHVKHETEQAVLSNAQIIIYHDTDIDEVLQAIIDTLADTDYKIFRVTDTRVSYAVK